MAAPSSTADHLDHLRRRLLGRAGVVRRVGVVLDAELDRLGDILSRHARREVKRHVDSRGDPGGRDHLAVLDDALGDRLGAELRQGVAVDPVARRPLALEDARRPEDERPRADRGRPGRRLVRAANPVQDALVGHQRPVSLAARDQQDIGIGELLDRLGGLEPEAPGVGALDPRLRRDEVELGARQPRQDLVGPDRVERGEPSKISSAIRIEARRLRHARGLDVRGITRYRTTGGLRDRNHRGVGVDTRVPVPGVPRT